MDTMANTPYWRFLRNTHRDYSTLTVTWITVISLLIPHTHSHQQPPPGEQFRQVVDPNGHPPLGHAPPPPGLPTPEELEFDFDNQPGIQHEFKMEIPPARQECFFQYLRMGALFHMSFEVLRGADRNVDVIVKRPDGSPLAKHLWTNSGATDTTVDMEGIHALCIDNSFSRFSSKLIFLFFGSYVTEDWAKYTEDLEKYDASLGNFTVSIQKVDKNVRDARLQQTIVRQHAVKDWYIIQSNNSYVQFWSILTIVVVMLTNALQAYFVRRLFSTKDTTPGNSKPSLRA